MKNLLYDQFGFQLPNAIIKKSLSTMKESLKKENGVYNVIHYDNGDIDFSKYISDEIEHNKLLTSSLIRYAKENSSDVNIDTDLLLESFTEYMLDKSVSVPKYDKVISSFILKKSSNKDVKQHLDSIRIGLLLYLGLNYNIDNNKNFDDLTIFLDTEILFDIIGYNGVIYNDLAQDMLNLIKKANFKKQKIFIKYFKDTKQECDYFFSKAEELVMKSTPIENTAMYSILEGCKNASDVVDKQSDFYKQLQYKYGIIEDTEDAYYSQDKNEYNLEEMIIEESVVSDDNFEDSQRRQKSLKFISHINKLRKGELFTDYAKTKYIFITRTRTTIEISNSMPQESKINNTKLAISMNFFTNWMWCKLNRGFGADNFPKSIDVLIKAKIILSNFVSDEVLKLYTKFKEQYKSGQLTEDIMAFRIMALREKNTKPEDISSDNVDDELNFDDDFINRYREERDKQQFQLKLQNEKIKELTKENDNNSAEIERLKSEKNKIYCENYYERKKSEQINAEQKIELDKIKKQKLAEEARKILRNETFKRVLKISLGILIRSFFIFIVYWILKYFFPEETTITNLITIVAGIPTVYGFSRDDCKAVWKDIKTLFKK